MGGNLSLAQASNLQEAYALASLRSVEIGTAYLSVSDDDDDEDVVEDDSEVEIIGKQHDEIDEEDGSPVLRRSRGSTPSRSGGLASQGSGSRQKSSGRRQGTVTGVHIPMDGDRPHYRASSTADTFDMQGTIAAAFRIASSRSDVLANGRGASELVSWGLCDVASRTSSFAAF